MQTVSVALQAILDSGINGNADAPLYDFSETIEFYDPTHEPGGTGFDPTDAVKRFAGIELTWNGLAFLREAVSRGDVSRFLGKTFNSVSARFSNVDRELATWLSTTDVEGMRMVVRCVSRSVTDSSIVLSVARVDKPVEFDRIQANFSAKQDLGGIENEVPFYTFSPEDPDGRLPNDPLYQGFRFIALSGSFFRVETSVQNRSFLGFIPTARTVTLAVPAQWSSADSTPLGNPVPEAFGRVQIQLVPVMYADTGSGVRVLGVACKGPIYGMEEGRNVSTSLEEFAGQTIHLGDEGGTGTNTTEPFQFPGAGLFSFTAYIDGYVRGGDVNTDETPPTLVTVVLGRMIPLPDSGGDFTDEGWTHSGPYITRYLLNNEKWGNLPEAFINDASIVDSATYCAEPLFDTSNAEQLLIPNTDLPAAGTDFTRYRSTGILDTLRVRSELGIDPEPFGLIEADYDGYDETDPPNTFTTVEYLRERYTTNVALNEKAKLVDFLYDVVLPSFRGFLVINSKGQVEVRVQRPADNCLLKAASIVGATQLSIDDVDAWKTNLLVRGKVLIGTGLTTSEVRKVTSAVYNPTLGDAVTLVASDTGTITATASGATLSGGSASVPSSATVTIGGTPGAGDTVTATIDGIAVTHTLDALDTTSTVAKCLMYRINATLRLKRYVKAEWSDASPTVVTIKSKYGLLNLNIALASAHTGPTTDPTAAPVLASSAGVLEAGDYSVAYTYVNSLGETNRSPIASITLGANEKIDVSTITPPASHTVNWYVTRKDDDELLFLINNSGAAFSVNTLPDGDSPLPPDHNTTAEECIRVMMSFSDAGKNADGTVSDNLKRAGLTRNNITANSFKWPQGSKQSSINQIEIQFNEAKDDFAKTILKLNDRDHQLQVGKTNPLKINGAAIDNRHQAFRIANGALSKNREGNWFGTWTTSDPNAMLLEEGDITCVSDDGGGFVNIALRVEEARIAPNRSTTITGRLYTTRMFSDNVRSHVINLPTTLRYTELRPSILELVDGPPVYNEHGQTPGRYAFSSYDDDARGDYPGSALHADYGDGYKKIADFDAVAITGTCTTILPTVTNPGWDRTSSLTVQLDRGELTDHTEDDLKADARTNLAAVGNNTDGWEYVQFAGVTDNGDGEYEIAGPFYRGAFGTDDSRMTHHADDRFVLFNGAEKFVPMDPIRLNTEFDYKAVTTHQDVADATGEALKEDNIWNGGTARTLAPTNLTAFRDSHNDIYYRWNRQARYGQGMSPLSDVPEVEAAQKFLLEAFDGATLKRTMEVIPGTQLAAVLISESGFTGVSHNTFEPTNINTARTIQEVTQAGNFIEGNLVTEITGIAWSAMGLQVSGGSWKGFCSALVTDYGSGGFGATLDAPATIPYLVILEAKLTGIDYWQRFHVYEYGSRIFSASSLSGEADYDPEFGWTEFLPNNTGFMRVKFNFVGSSIRIQKAHTQNVPFITVATSQRAAAFPYFSVCAVNGIAGAYKVQDVRMTIYPQPATIYSATQQTEDGFTPGDLIKVRAKEVSSIVGPGAYREAMI